MDDESGVLLETIKDQDPDLQIILMMLLEFNPAVRWSAKDCLKSPYFDSVRNPLLEQKAEFPISLEVD